MPKEKLSHQALIGKIRQHKIYFKGCCSPSAWPTEHQDLFHKVREISRNQFESHVEDQSSLSSLVTKRRAEVKKLCTKAQDLHNEISTHERHWRAVEPIVFNRFEEHILCVHGGEWWPIPEYEAVPTAENLRTQLFEERTKRFVRTCNEAATDRHQDRFHKIPDSALTHQPGDDLARYNISMTPDLMVGLFMNKSYDRHIGDLPLYREHCPAQDQRQCIHPFLVVEAKQEKNAPGFRGIEIQTAFAIRRLLLSQNQIRVDKQLEFQPLVWFFAYRGEIWRLYGGVLKDESVVEVYDLWLGSLQSEDSALQLFQIIDLIWSWARDVYRPQIRRGLRTYPASSRASSPTITIPLRRSSSIGEPSSRPWEGAGGDNIAPLGSETDAPARPRLEISRAEAARQNFLPQVSDHNHHAFRQLARPDRSFPGMDQVTMQHANIVKFAFHYLYLPPAENAIYKLVSMLDIWLSDMLRRDDYIISLHANELEKLEAFWTGTTDEVVNLRNRIDTGFANLVCKAFIFCKSSFDVEEWMIRRDLFCIFWTAETVAALNKLYDLQFDENFDDNNPQMTNISEVSYAFQLMRSTTGRESVAYAYKNARYLLDNSGDQSQSGSPLAWRDPAEDRSLPIHLLSQVEVVFADCRREEFIQGHIRSILRVLHIKTSSLSPDVLPGSLTQNDLEYGDENGMMIRWSRDSTSAWPAFRVFLFQDDAMDDKMWMLQCLKAAIENSWLVLGDVTELDAEEARILRRWTKRFIKL